MTSLHFLVTFVETSSLMNLPWKTIKIEYILESQKTLIVIFAEKLCNQNKDWKVILNAHMAKMSMMNPWKLQNCNWRWRIQLLIPLNNDMVVVWIKPWSGNETTFLFLSRLVWTGCHVIRDKWNYRICSLYLQVTFLRDPLTWLDSGIAI